MALSLFGKGRGEASLDDLIRRKQYPKAVELLKAELHKRKRDRSLRLKLADVLALAGRHSEAAGLLNGLADELALAGFAAQAIALLKRVQALHPGQVDIEEKLAYLITQQNRPAPDPWAVAGFRSPAAPRPEPAFGMEEIGDDPDELGVFGSGAHAVPSNLEPRASEELPAPEVPAADAGVASAPVAPPPPAPEPPAAAAAVAAPAAAAEPQLDLESVAPEAGAALDLAGLAGATAQPSAQPSAPPPAAPPPPAATPAAPAAPRTGSEPRRGVGPAPDLAAAAASVELSEDALRDELAGLIEDVFRPAEPEPAPVLRVETPLFRDFSPDELVEVIRGLKLRRFAAGEILVTEGEPGRSLYVLTSGQVRAYVRDAQGRNVEIRQLVEGDFFGEAAALTGQPRSATLTAIGDCELLELDRAALDEISQRKPRVWDVMLEFHKARRDNTLESLIRGR